MSGNDLKSLRTARGWTQAELAEKLLVSQGYLSQLERGVRPFSQELALRAVKTLAVPPMLLAPRDPARWLAMPEANGALARALGKLGYPGFAHLRGGERSNPVEVLLGALIQPNLETRVAEGLPWLALAYAEMDWKWAVHEAKVNDLQNRLGFVLALATAVAERGADFLAAGKLKAVEHNLERSRLQREEAFCYDSLTEAERTWVADRRSPEAVRWRMISDLTAESLRHAA
ncbi:MAG: helix-turn-helix transcriptional regulator [Acidobacteriaceae bacterium]